MSASLKVGVPDLSEETAVAPRTGHFTIEGLAYLVIGVLALTTRIWALDAWPLRTDEAWQAWGAWNLAHGRPLGVIDYSPILMALNQVLFGLFHASDAMARLGPALCGVLLALSPVMLRYRLGKWGALFASLMVALSPTVMFVSRSLDGRIFAMTAGLVLVFSLVRLFDRRERSSIFVGVAALAIGLLSAPIFFSLLLLLIIGVALLWFLRHVLGIGGLSEKVRLSRIVPAENPKIWYWAGMVFAVTLALLGTGFLLNLDGLGAAAGLLPAWLHGFLLGQSPAPTVTVLWSLVVYETPLLLFGIAGLVIGWLRRDVLVLLLGWWTIGGLLLSLVAGGWTPPDLLLLSVPLAILAGLFLGELFGAVVSQPLEDGEWLLIAGAPGLATYGFLEFAAYARKGEPVHLIFGLAVPVLLLLAVSALVWAWMGWRRALRGAVLGVAIVAMVVSFALAWNLSHNTNPARYDLFTAERVDTGVRDLVQVMQRYSSQGWKGSFAASTLVVDDGLGWLRWYMREFDDVQFVHRFDTAERRPLVITPLEVEPPLGEEYQGQSITLASSWWPMGMSDATLARWLLYRSSSTTIQRESVILWIQRQ